MRPSEVVWRKTRDRFEPELFEPLHLMGLPRFTVRERAFKDEADVPTRWFVGAVDVAPQMRLSVEQSKPTFRGCEKELIPYDGGGRFLRRLVPSQMARGQNEFVAANQHRGELLTDKERLDPDIGLVRLPASISSPLRILTSGGRQTPPGGASPSVKNAFFLDVMESDGPVAAQVF